MGKKSGSWKISLSVCLSFSAISEPSGVFFPCLLPLLFSDFHYNSTVVWNFLDYLILQVSVSLSLSLSLCHSLLYAVSFDFPPYFCSFLSFFLSFFLSLSFFFISFFLFPLLSFPAACVSVFLFLFCSSVPGFLTSPPPHFSFFYIAGIRGLWKPKE